MIPRPDGSLRLDALLDPESGALVTAAVDAVTAPRRGGPRFVDPDQNAAAQRIIDDSRTTEQIALDALVDMIRIATRAHPSTVFAQKQPSVRVHVTLADLERRAVATQAKLVDLAAEEVGDISEALAGDDPDCTGDAASPGHGCIEGNPASLSLPTIERLACETGYIPILFDKGQPLDVGRSQRLFTANQRIALAARDGGCTRSHRPERKPRPAQQRRQLTRVSYG